MNGPFLVELNITTFRGVGIGAEHWYGKFNVYSKRDANGIMKVGYNAWQHPNSNIELTRILDEKEAAYLREKDNCAYWPMAGEKTMRFNTREDIESIAVERFSELFQLEDLLIVERKVGNVAISGNLKEAYNTVDEHEQWKWLDANGFLKDHNYTYPK